MIRASQRAVVQEANMNLINIRNIEVEYFRNFFTQFGTQCALMVGLIAGSISQAPGLPNPAHAPYPWLVVYWIGSAGTVATAIHVLVCTVFITVFGQGLAIRGPLGSMITAVEGMIIEQQQVLFFYILTIIFFALQSVGLYWVMMDWISATVSTIITFFASFFWYHHSLRIYNRFYWNKDNIDWDDEHEQSPDEALQELYPHLDLSKYKPINNNTKKKTTINKMLKTKARPKFFDNSEGFGFNKKNKDNQSEISNEYFNTDNENDTDDIIGGYMSISVPGGKTIFGIKKSNIWERKYFIIKNTIIFYYDNEEAYKKNPNKPINRRPIDLEGFNLIAGSMEPPYLITLVPIDPDDVRRSWKFSCDTVSEFEYWINIITNSLKLCNNYDNNEIIRVEGKNIERLSQVTYDYEDEDDEELNASLAAYAAARNELGSVGGSTNNGGRMGYTGGTTDQYVLYEDNENNNNTSVI